MTSGQGRAIFAHRNTADSGAPLACWEQGTLGGGAEETNGQLTCMGARRSLHTASPPTCLQRGSNTPTLSFAVSSPPYPGLPHEPPVGSGWQQLYTVGQCQQRRVLPERE